MARWLAHVGFLLLAFAATSVAQAACTIAAGTMNFGAYTGTTLSGVGTLSVTCPSAVAWNIGINAGLHGSGANYNLNLLGPSSTLLNYTLYRNAAHSQLWGGTVGLDTISGTGTGGAQTVTFYAQAAANSGVVPGTYTDTVTTMLYSVNPTVSSSIAVSATVAASCTVAAGNLAFGVYTGAASATASATITALCTNTTTYQIGSDLGLHSQFGYLFMMGPAAGQGINNILQYHLYTDAARTQVWGSTAGTNEISGTGSGSAQPITIYGQVNSGHYEVNPGAYTDTVTVTINF